MAATTDTPESKSIFKNYITDLITTCFDVLEDSKIPGRRRCRVTQELTNYQKTLNLDDFEEYEEVHRESFEEIYRANRSEILKQVDDWITGGNIKINLDAGGKGRLKRVYCIRLSIIYNKAVGLYNKYNEDDPDNDCCYFIHEIMITLYKIFKTFVTRAIDLKKIDNAIADLDSMIREDDSPKSGLFSGKLGSSLANLFSSVSNIAKKHGIKVPDMSEQEMPSEDNIGQILEKMINSDATNEVISDLVKSFGDSKDKQDILNNVAQKIGSEKLINEISKHTGVKIDRDQLKEGSDKAQEIVGKMDLQNIKSPEEAISKIPELVSAFPTPESSKDQPSSQATSRETSKDDDLKTSSKTSPETSKDDGP